MRNSKRRGTVAAALTFTMAGLLALSADAAPPSTVSLSPAQKHAGACAWSQALPPLPASCNGLLTPANGVDTVAKCGSTAFWANACGSNKTLPPAGSVPAGTMAQTPIVQLYCHKALVENYCTDPNEESLVPADKNTRSSAISPLKNTAGAQPANWLVTSQLPGRGGHQTGFTAAPHKGGKSVPRFTYAGPTSSQTGGPWAQTVSSTGGTYETSMVSDWVGKYNGSRTHQANIHFLGLKGQAAATENTSLFTILGQDKYVGDGTFNAQNLAVNSCAEFAYQRWYDYTRFKNAAKALGRDYRSIYHLAFSSPFDMEKRQLKQFGIGDLPQSWPRPAEDNIVQSFPHNIFLTAPAVFRSTVDSATTQAIKNRQIPVIGPQSGHDGFYVHLPSQPTRFATHKAMASLLDTQYHMTDDDFAERGSRMRRYQELVNTRIVLQQQILCGADPGLCCGGDPFYNGGTSNAVMDKVRGATVINPDPNALGAFGSNVSNGSPYSSFQSTEATSLSSKSFSLKGLSNPANAIGGFKQKTYTPVSTPLTPVTGSVASIAGTCQSRAQRQGTLATQALVPIQNQMSDMIVAEWAQPNHGCLETPTGIGNTCDWSYEKFAHMMETYFDSEVEDSFTTCVAQTRGDFSTARDAAKQDRVYPCEERHDFGDDQLDTQYFLDSVQDRGPRYSCEVLRGSQAVQDYLAQNAALVRQIPILADHIGESSSDSWQLGDESSFGAKASYSLAWSLHGGENNKKTADGAWCHPDGSSAMSAAADIYFFGSRTRVFDGAASETTGDSSTTYGTHMRYYDMDQAPSTDLIDLFPAVAPGTTLAGSPVKVPVGDPQSLGDLSYDIWFTVGPIPIHISFGANATTGIDVEAIGHHSTNGCQLAGNKGIETVNLGYASGTDFEPWAQADAYADASIDILIASAGIRMDLTLLHIGLPVGVNTSTDAHANLTMKTGCHLTTDALEGNVSAYLTLGIDPFSHTWSTTIFSWDGMHSDTTLFGTTANVPLKLATWAAQPAVNNVKCLAKPNPGPVGNKNNTPPLSAPSPFSSQPTLAGHPDCMKNPTEANGCTSPINAASVGCAPYYNMRGPLR